MSAPTSDQLAGFLANPPFTEVHHFRHAESLIHTAACQSAEIPGLEAFAARIPIGLSILKYGSRSIVGSHRIDGRPVVLKYYLPSGFIKHFTYGIRGSRCRQSWVAGLAFGFIGVPTPAPLMIAEWRRLGGTWLNKSFLATEKAEGIPLAAFAESHADDDPRLARVVKSLHRAFSTMVRYRAVHGDLKASNILVAPDGSISFIDLDAAEFLLPEARWRKLREKDRRRFFKNWNGNPRLAKLFQNVFDT